MYYACESLHKDRNTKVYVPIIVLWSMDQIPLGVYGNLTFENPPAGSDQDV